MNTYLEEYICESMGNHNFFLPSLFLLPRSNSLLEILKNLQAGLPALE